MRTRFDGRRAAAATATALLLAAAAAAPAAAITKRRNARRRRPSDGRTPHGPCRGRRVPLALHGHAHQPDGLRHRRPLHRARRQPGLRPAGLRPDLLQRRADRAGRRLTTSATTKLRRDRGLSLRRRQRGRRQWRLFLHPEYDPGAFFEMDDLGVVVLDEPYELEEYGSLPELDQLDELEPGPAHQVRLGRLRTPAGARSGCGLARHRQPRPHGRASVPAPDQHRTGASSPDFAMLLSNNPTTGGTCFGDSGGPNFLAGTLTIAAVTSFGTNWACGGTGGVYRIDRADDLAFIESFP